MAPSRSNSQGSARSEKHDSRPHTPEQSQAAASPPRSKATLGILRDWETDSVPGSVFLLSGPPGAEKKNAPLGVKHAPRRPSASKAPSSAATPMQSPGEVGSPRTPVKKKTADGKTILDPQPDETKNDPLNWSMMYRNLSLLSLGLYCMVGGGMTPVLAAGFNKVAAQYNVEVTKVALTTGLYMLGLGVGSVIMSPTAIIFGKRPVYLATAVMFILTSIWCAASPTYNSLLIARIFQGISVSPTECLPSSSIAEIFFLHERAYRLGIYTLLLLSGKNLVPLVSAAIMQSMSWRWVFWIVAIVVGFCLGLLFFFVPETFWDRAPRPPPQRHRDEKDRPGLFSRQLSALTLGLRSPKPARESDEKTAVSDSDSDNTERPQNRRAPSSETARAPSMSPSRPSISSMQSRFHLDEHDRAHLEKVDEVEDDDDTAERPQPTFPTIDTTIAQTDFADPQDAHKPTSPSRLEAGQQQQNMLSPAMAARSRSAQKSPAVQTPSSAHQALSLDPYTAYYQQAAPKGFVASLKPFDGRLNHHPWWRIALRPFILYTYPAILWSSAVYALSIGWLIVLSESVAHIYQSPETYNFTSLQAGLVYISPFIGGICGTAIAGKVSDVIVRAMTRKNGGLYEPEFRLVMAIPVTIATVIGLMGYGWSVEEHDKWIVPTVFFGIISFGCSLGSTTAITFAVDSYRMYAGPALVTLNFSKNILHGLVFSLFFTNWLEHQGPRKVFVVLGGIQIAFLISTIPMYIYGKRARMWTTRKKYAERI